MAITQAQYLEALKNNNSNEVIFKIEILDKYENIIDTITNEMLDGSVNINLQNGTRRSASLTLMNINNKFTPNDKGLIWLNAKFKISSGIKVNGEDYLFSNGIYCLSEPEINSKFTETTASFNLVDKWALCDGSLKGTLKADYIIPVGTNIGDAVKSIISTELLETKPPIITPTAIVSPYTLTLNRGDNFGDMLIKLAEMISYECFFDKEGYFRFQPIALDSTRPSEWDFSTDEFSYLGASRKYQWDKIKNSIYVYGDNINGSQVIGNAQDTYLFSPTRIALIDERVIVVVDEIISTIPLATERANYELRKATISQELVSINCVPIFSLDESKIITLTDLNLDLDRERYLTSSINLRLSYDSEMTLNVWKIRPLE